MTVVIAGCGDLGTEVGLRLASRMRRVVGLRRTAHKLPRQIEGQSVDLSTQVPTLPGDTTVVMIAMSPDERTVEAYRSAYVASVRNVASAIRRDCARPPRVVYVSSTAVYGVDDGSWVNAATPAEPTAPTAIVLREAEQTLLEFLPDAVILRLAGIYGPGRTRQIDSVRAGTAMISHQQRFTNLIHRDDAAAALVHLSTMTDTPDGCYIGVDNCPVDQSAVVEFLASLLGEATPSRAADSESERGVRGKRCANDRLLASGFELTYPTYREGYAAVLAGEGIRHP